MLDNSGKFQLLPLSLEKVLEQITAIALQIQRCNHPEDIFQRAIADMRGLLQADRVLVYRFLSKQDAVVAFESVCRDLQPRLGELISAPSLQETWLERCRSGTLTAIADDWGDLPVCPTNPIEPLQVQENTAALIAPIYHQETLWGLLALYRCRSLGGWQPIEVQYGQQIALHLGIAVQQIAVQPEKLPELKNLPELASPNLQQTQSPVCVEQADRFSNQLSDRFSNQLSDRSGNQLSHQLSDRHPQTQLQTQPQTNPVMQPSSDLLSLALRAAKAGMWYWDFTTQETFWSDENFRLLGYDPQIHKPSYEAWLNAVHPEERETVHRHISEVIAQNISNGVQIYSANLEYRILLPNSEVRWSADIGEILYDASGNPTGIIGIQIDITDRKQAELALQQLNQELELRVQQRTEALQQSEARWEFALEGAGDGIWDWNVQTNQVFLSRQWATLLGYAEDEIDNTLEDWASRIHPDDHVQCEAKLADHFSGKTPIYRQELRVRCKDGSLKWILDRGKVVTWDAQGQPLRMVGIHTDITDRKHAEEQLQTLSNRQKLAIEAGNLGVWDWDLTSDRITWDDHLHQMYDIPPSESGIDYATWEARIHPDDLAACRAAVEQRQVLKTAVRVEFRILLPNGTVRYIESCALTTYDSQGRPNRIIGVDLDITERRLLEAERNGAEAALREHQQFLEQIAESTLAIIYVYDLIEQRSIFCSQQIETVLGYSPDEILSMGSALFPQLVHPQDLHSVLHKAEALSQIQDNEYVELEYRIRHKAGGYRWLLSRDRISQRTSSGAPQHMLGIAVDVTNLKESQVKLRQQAERDRLLMTIAQNIRQTLDLEQILATAVEEVRQLLQVDRVVIHRFDAAWNGTVVAESVTAGWQSLLGKEIMDSWLEEGRFHQREQLTAIEDIYRADLYPHQIAMLEQIQVRAKLVVPIVQGNCLWGLLAAHHCEEPRPWQPFEIALQQQLATQLAIALQQSELHQQVQTLNTQLELQVRERTAQLQQSLHFEELLKRITDRVRDSLDEQEILQAAVDELALGLQVEICDTGIYSADQTTSTIAYEYTNAPSQALGHSFTIAEAPNREVYLLLFQGQVCQFCGIDLDHLRPHQGRGAILACPILDENGILGDLWLFKAPQAWFNELEVRLVQQVANQCAIALRQSRLFQAAQLQVQELERLNRLKDDFLSTVSHELRTPVSNIRMATQMLEISLNRLGILGDLTNPIDRYLNVLRTEGQREIGLINDLLDLTRLDAETEPLNLVPIELQFYIPHLAESFVERAHRQQQQIVIRIPENLPTFTTDLSDLERILSELLNNACKYTPEGGTITVSGAKTSEHLEEYLEEYPEEYLELRVSNSGVEISPAERDRIFDKFYRIPNSDPWKHGGTGLGLALVKKLVERLGGTIRVESETGETRFTLKFPLSIG
ncbi:PAS domain-containing protein [Leptolyngbya ohadii]|uniref:PAS domain-containing protein n=1 Tax=Leptolyngbya ohadii TaxID=1962290 RepID=UPI000B599E53|nr:PAS domain-containing protein [Leptolyngbya ohadii]